MLPKQGIAEQVGYTLFGVQTMSETYSLEYGEDTVEIHIDAIKKNQNILLVDDLIATGGTANASYKLVKNLDGVIKECCFIIDLPENFLTNSSFFCINFW